MDYTNMTTEQREAAFCGLVMDFLRDQGSDVVIYLYAGNYGHLVSLDDIKLCLCSEDAPWDREDKLPDGIYAYVREKEDALFCYLHRKGFALPIEDFDGTLLPRLCASLPKE